MNKLLARAQKIMPGGVSSPVRALKAVNGKPMFTKYAKGAYLYDIHDQQYIDLCMSFGPLILGHAHPEIVTAIQQATAKGTSYGTSTVQEVELAEKIIELHTGVEWLRFVNSGTEALMSAIRLARGITQRDVIVKFAGCYHGHADSLLVKAGSGLSTFGISSSLGVPQGTSKDTLVLELGNVEQLTEAMQEYGEQVAAVLIEGVPANNGLLIQSKAFMKLIERLCTQYGAMFIVDEVITGFRLGLGGATEYYNLNPDIVTFGKVIGGGLPVGAYGGKLEYMQYISPLGGVYQAGTLSGNPLAMAAGIKTLDLLQDNTAYVQLEEAGEYLQTNLQKVFEEKAIPITYHRIGSINWMLFAEQTYPIAPAQISDAAVQQFNVVHPAMRKLGVYMPPSAYEVMFLSTAHTVEVLDSLVEKFQEGVTHD